MRFCLNFFIGNCWYSFANTIVSLDFCADQYTLKFAEPETIAALSVDAGKAFSYMRGHASDHPQIRGRVEEVLALQPDLIIRAYGGGPGAVAFFEAAGIPVLQIGWANDLAALPFSFYGRIENLLSEPPTWVIPNFRLSKIRDFSRLISRKKEREARQDTVWLWTKRTPQEGMSSGHSS